MSYNKFHIFLALGIAEAYKPKNNRKKELELNGLVIEYDKEKSTDVYAHYETADAIILFSHGASALEQQVTAIKKFLKPSADDEVVKKFCKKYDELLHAEKQVFIVAHSLSGWMLAECGLRTGKQIPGLAFAPYVPQEDSKIVNHMRTSKDIQKVLFLNDWFGNNLLQRKNLNNAIVLEPQGVQQKFNSHALFNFTKPLNNKFRTF